MEYILNKNTLSITNNNKTIHIDFLKNQTLRIYEKKVPQDLYEIFEKVDNSIYDISLDNGLKISYNNKVIHVDNDLNINVIKNDETYISLSFSNDCGLKSISFSPRFNTTVIFPVS